MSKPLVNFADPEQAIVDYLTGKVSASVATYYPTSSSQAPATPFVQVAWDGTPVVAYPITERATVRVTCWDQNPTPAKSLAAQVQGLLATHPGDGAVWAVQPLTGPLPTRDPQTALYAVTATYRVSLRPTAVTP